MAGTLSQEELDALLDAIEDDKPADYSQYLKGLIEFLEKPYALAGDINTPLVVYELEKMQFFVNYMKCLVLDTIENESIKDESKEVGDD